MINSTTSPLSAQKIKKGGGEVSLRPNSKGVCKRTEAGTSSSKKLTRAQSAEKTRQSAREMVTTAKTTSKGKRAVRRV